MNRLLHKNIYLSFLVSYLCCLTLTACSKTQPMKLVITNQKKSNTFKPHQSLPLDLKAYSTLKKNGLNLNDFHTFWQQPPKNSPPGNKQVGAFTLIPDSHQNHMLRLPSGNHYIRFFAHFYNPQNKTWNVSLKIPRNSAWQQHTLYLNITETGMNAHFTAKKWLHE